MAFTDRDYPGLDTLYEILAETKEYIDEALQSHDDVRMGAYLGLAVRALKSAALIYGDHLKQNRIEMQQGEKI